MSLRLELVQGLHEVDVILVLDLATIGALPVDVGDDGWEGRRRQSRASVLRDGGRKRDARLSERGSSGIWREYMRAWRRGSHQSAGAGTV